MSTTGTETSPARGLSSGEAERRRRGEANIAVSGATRSYTSILRTNVLNFFNIILFVIGVALLALGRYSDALISVGLGLINAAISATQEIRAKRKLDSLQLLDRAPVRVVRDGSEVELAPEAVVRGDLLHVRAGDQIVVDGPLLDGGPVEADDAVESVSNVDVVCTDKTGTLTTGRLALEEVEPLADGVDAKAALGAFAAAVTVPNLTSAAIAAALPAPDRPWAVESGGCEQGERLRDGLARGAGRGAVRLVAAVVRAGRRDGRVGARRPGGAGPAPARTGARRGGGRPCSRRTAGARPRPRRPELVRPARRRRPSRPPAAGTRRGRRPGRRAAARCRGDDHAVPGRRRGPQGAVRRQPPDRRPTVLVAVLLVAFGAVLFVPAVSTYFGLTAGNSFVSRLVGAAVVAWFVVLSAAYRFRLLDRILGSEVS